MNTRNVHLLLFMALTALPLHGDRTLDDRRTHLESTPIALSKPADIVQTATNIWSSIGPADGINMLVIDPHDQNVIYARIGPHSTGWKKSLSMILSTLGALSGSGRWR